MLATQRRHAIEEQLRAHGSVLVNDIADKLGVTPETVRRDLDLLERTGKAQRVHGGAVAPGAHSLAEPSTSERLTRHADAKARIGTLAATRLLASPTQSMFIDAGTTTAALARQLVTTMRPEQRLVATTHTPEIAQILAQQPSLDVHMTGGRIRGITGAAVGAQTVLAIARMRPDLVLVATNGITAHGLTTPDLEEAAVKEAIVASGRRVAVLADSSKFGVETLCTFATLDEIDVLITDAEPPKPIADALRAAGCEVFVA